MYDQLCDILCFGCDNTDCKVLGKNAHNDTSTYACIDNNKAFDTRISEHVSSDTVSDLVHKVNNNLWCKTHTYLVLLTPLFGILCSTLASELCIWY